MAMIAADAEQLRADNFQLISISELEKDLSIIEGAVANTIDAQAASDRLEEETSVALGFQNNWSQTIQELAAQTMNQDDEAKLEEIKAHADIWYGIVSETLALAAAGQDTEAIQTFDRGETELSAGEEGLTELMNEKQALFNKRAAEAQQTYASARLSIIGGMAAALLVGIGVAFFLARSISSAARQMADAAEAIATGELDRKITVKSKDEIGDMAASFERMIIYLQGMAGVAQKLAIGDLTQNVTPISNNDVLGNAFKDMVDSLREAVGQVAESASAVSSAASQLASASEQSGEASRQIATTIQQVALGTAQQTAGVTKTSASVEQMNRAIEGVARGAQEQAKAISQASLVTSRISAAIEQVTSNAQAVTRDSAEAASHSRDGAKTVQETITGMETIRTKVGLSAAKVEEMGTRSEEIGAIVETIEDIASQTNLLALNAAIEAARAGGSGKQTNEKLVQTHLVSVAKLLAEMLYRTSNSLRSQDLAEIARRLNVETLNVSDSDGVVVISSQPDAIGFRFPDKGKGQAASFRSLLGQSEGVIAQPAMSRESDGKLYLYVGVSRRDQPGIIQIGTSAQMLMQFEDISRGFTVVAEEVRKLAERASLSTKEIAALIKGIQKTVSEAVSAMKESASEVEAGVSRAHSAGQVLDDILGAAESVYKQAEEAGAAAAKVSAAASELVEAVDSVSAVIEENTAATEQMAANSSELTQAIENIASVSEENSASVEEVSASTEEVSAQVEQVSASAASMTEMAQTLQQVVAQFKLGPNTGNLNVTAAQ
jgi:methyl-accepting chemotaxis protein